MTRADTVGKGLSQLDQMIDELTPEDEVNAPPPNSKGLSRYDLATAALVLAMSSVIAIVFYPPPTWARCENSCVHSHDGICDDGGVEKWPFEGARAGSGGACALGSDCGDCGQRNFAIPKHFFIIACLVTTALLIVGIEQTVKIFQDHLARDVYRDASNFRKIRVPLTDFPFGATMVNKLANSTQVREKTLKCCQYIFRGLAFSGCLSSTMTKNCKQLSKATSIARRFFKFGRWIKHFEDLEEAREQLDGTLRFLLYFRIAANFGADWAEDVCSLQRIGVLPDGTLSISFMLFAEYCQLALALVEILVTGVRARKEAEVTVLAHQKERDGNDVSEAKLLQQVQV